MKSRNFVGFLTLETDLPYSVFLRNRGFCARATTQHGHSDDTSKMCV